MEQLKFPKHIAIIMDGNGRWAKSKALPVKLGHKQGAENLRKITDAAIELGVEYLTAYAFSTENWRRSKQEVEALMDLMNSYLDQYTKEAGEKNTRVRIIGDISKLSERLQKKIVRVQELTKEKTGLSLNIAINYGGRDEIVRAAKKIAQEGIDPDKITEDLFCGYMDTAGIPDPDLLIRTSGEIRVSNFLLWQIAYSEIYISNKLWPDFNKTDLTEAINSFGHKDRRFGAR